MLIPYHLWFISMACSYVSNDFHFIVGMVKFLKNRLWDTSSHLAISEYIKSISLGKNYLWLFGATMASPGTRRLCQKAATVGGLFLSRLGTQSPCLHHWDFKGLFSKIRFDNNHSKGIVGFHTLHYKRVEPQNASSNLVVRCLFLLNKVPLKSQAIIQGISNCKTKQDPKIIPSRTVWWGSGPDIKPGNHNGHDLRNQSKALKAIAGCFMFYICWLIMMIKLPKQG